MFEKIEKTIRDIILELLLLLLTLNLTFLSIRPFVKRF
ncbi:putative membrane protein [Desulfosporosinus sp. OT]|nr:putative membrane protein [Desulfosporosinus sp. OT]